MKRLPTPAIAIALLLAACDAQVTAPPLPVADAGPDVRAELADDLALELRGFAQSEAKITRWGWEVRAPPGANTAVEGAGGPTLTLRPRTVGSYVVKLTVEAEGGAVSEPDYALVEVLPPGAGPADLVVVVTAAPQPAHPGEVVTLQAAIAGDDPGDVQWSWTIDPADAAVLRFADPRAPIATFVAALPSGQPTWTYRFVAGAVSGARQGMATVLVRVEESGLPQVVATLACETGGGACGAAAPEGAAITLSVTVTEPAGGAHDVAWSRAFPDPGAIAGTPPDVVANGDTATLVLPRVQADTEVELHALVSADAHGAVDLVLVLGITNAPDQPPTVGVRPPQVEVLPGDVVVIAADAADPDGDPLTCTWTVAAEAIPRVVEEDASTCERWTGRVLAGPELSVRLTVEAGGQSASDTATVPVVAPVLVAGAGDVVNTLAAGPSGAIYAGLAGDTARILRPDGSWGDLADPWIVGDTAVVFADPSGQVWLAPDIGDLFFVSDADAVAAAPVDDELRVYDLGGVVYASLTVDGGGGVIASGQYGDVVFVATDGYAYRQNNGRNRSGRAVLGLGSLGEALLGDWDGLWRIGGLSRDSYSEDSLLTSFGVAGHRVVQRLVRGAGPDVWLVSMDGNQDELALHLVDVTDPSAPRPYASEWPMASRTSSSQTSAGHAAAEASGDQAGDLWVPEGPTGLSRISRGTLARHPLGVPAVDGAGDGLEYRVVLVTWLGGRRQVWLGTNRGLFVMPR